MVMHRHNETPTKCAEGTATNTHTQELRKVRVFDLMATQTEAEFK